MAKDEGKKEIIEDLNKSGFPTEVKVQQVLEKDGWMIKSSLFEDSDASVHREIDIHALKIDFRYMKKAPKKTKAGDENKFISHLLIEIKKSDKPWIFFNNGFTNWPWVAPENYKSENTDFHYLMIDDLKELGLKTHRYENSTFHKSYHVAFSKPSQPSPIYESLVKTSKSIRYFKKQYGTGKYVIHNFIPLVIFEGKLWSAYLNKDQDIDMKQVNHLFVTHNELIYDEKHKRKYDEEEFCEIVTKEGLSDYLKLVKRDNAELYKAWTSFINP